MSQSVELELVCAQCGIEFSRPAHHLVDMENEADSEVLWQLQNGSLNKVECPKCGALGFIPVPVALNVPEQQLMLVYVPNVQTMDEQQLGEAIGPIIEEFIVNLPEERQADYMLQPVVTDELETLQAASRGEVIGDELDEDGQDFDGDEDYDEDGEELTEEEAQALMARRELLQQLFQGADSLERISMMRNSAPLVDDLFQEMLAALTEQAEAVQPELVPLLQKIMNEAEVFIASNQPKN